MRALKWGFIGTGAIAKAFATGLGMTESGIAYAAGSRSKETAEQFAGDFDTRFLTLGSTKFAQGYSYFTLPE